jgi:methyl-accepting chemotaxis protein
MIGVAGFLKYRLDKAETALAAPDSALATEQDMSGRLRRSLGYGGFLGFAQTFVGTHDATALTDMKAQLKAAKEIYDRLPEKIPTETRRDLQSIIGMFQAVMDRAERATANPDVSFSNADLMPLYAALPIMDARVENAAATSRLAAQAQLQFWAMLLTLVAWASLIIASAMAVNVYLALRDRNSAPLRALTQSVKNMAHGDMRTSIWGMERQDTIGELARAVDQARYHFSQLPDIALLSDSGPVRMRFEGQAKSMFEAMMQVFGRDSEKMRDQAVTLSEAINRQEEALTLISSRVEAVLHNVEKRGMDGDQQIKRVVQNMTGNAEALQRAQQHAADQLGRLLPYMQERAQNMAEIAQLTGRQVAQALQSLTVTERGLRTSADQSDVAIKKLSSTADELGQRLFGAVNLLQASGKVLSETTEKTQSRLNEVLDKLGLQTGIIFATPSPLPVARTADISGIDSAHITNILAALEKTQSKLEKRVLEHAEATQAQISLLSTQSNGLLSQTTTAAQTLAAAADHMRNERTKFEESLTDAIARLHSVSSHITSETSQALHKRDIATLYSHDYIEGLKVDIARMSERLQGLDDIIEIAAKPSPVLIDLAAQVAVGFKQTTTAFSALRSDIDMLDRALKVSAEASPLLTGMAGQISNGFEDVSAMLGDIRNGMARLDQSVQAAAEPSPLLLDQLSNGFDNNTANLGEIRMGLLQLEQTVLNAAQPSPLIVGMAGQVMNGFELTNAMLGDLRGEIRRLDQGLRDATQPSPLLLGLTGQMANGFDNATVAIDSLQNDIQKLNEALQHAMHQASQPSPQLLELTGQMTNTLTGGFDRTAGAIDILRSDLRQLAEITTEILKSSTLQTDVQDRWYQLAAQVEATRNDLAAVITQQVDRLEQRIAPGAEVSQSVAATTAPELGTQRQMEQQTLILSELVATLGALDEHMQQLKTEMHAAKA